MNSWWWTKWSFETYRVVQNCRTNTYRKCISCWFVYRIGYNTYNVKISKCVTVNIIRSQLYGFAIPLSILKSTFPVTVEKNVQLFQAPNCIMSSATSLQVRPSVRWSVLSFLHLDWCNTKWNTVGPWVTSPRAVKCTVHSQYTHVDTLRLATYERRSLKNSPRIQRLFYIHFMEALPFLLFRRGFIFRFRFTTSDSKLS